MSTRWSLNDESVAPRSFETPSKRMSWPSKSTRAPIRRSWSLEAAPVLAHRDLQAKLAQHVDGQLDVGAFVDLAGDLDRGRLKRERRQHQQPRDPLRKRAVDPHPAATGDARVDRDGQAVAVRLEPHAEVGERSQQRTNRAAPE